MTFLDPDFPDFYKNQITLALMVKSDFLTKKPCGWSLFEKTGGVYQGIFTKNAFRIKNGGPRFGGVPKWGSKMEVRFVDFGVRFFDF